MPLAIITYRPLSALAKFSDRIAEILPSIIAQTLNVPGHPHASLTNKDTEVRLVSGSALDINSPEIAIQIFANDYEERKVNLDERTKNISELIKQSKAWSPSLEGKVYVWVMLFPGSFVSM